MIIKINQTIANGKNTFEILKGEELLYTAKTPWMAMDLPFKMENARKLTFEDNYGHQIYSTNYKIIDNIIEQMLPVMNGKFGRYEVLENSITKGAFYTKVNGTFDEKIILEYEGRIYTAYNVSKGKIDTVNIFDGDKQIAQITKPAATLNNLDEYFLHLLDDYENMLPILSFFTIYFDYINYRNAGTYVSKGSAKIKYQYSFGKVGEKYDESWIFNNFGEEAASELNQRIIDVGKEAKIIFNKTLKILIIVFAIAYSAFGLYLILK